MGSGGLMIGKRVVVIGGGPGGYVAAIRAGQLGAKPILIEKDRIGGTYLNRGCIPTKTLLHDAKLLRSLRSSPVFQSYFDFSFDPLESMMDRKAKVVREMGKGVEILLDSHKVTVKYGQADLLGPRQVTLSQRDGKKEIIDADAIILAPGSQSKPLTHIPLDGKKILGSDEALEIKKTPGEIMIIGGGYIGIEFATLFSALGSKVTIVEVLDNILLGLEGELVRNLRRCLEADGVKILTQSIVEDIRPYDGGLKWVVKTPQGIQEGTAEKLLVSVGRVPNLELDFSKAGVGVSSTGIRINQRMETSSPHIYAIGDAIGGTMLAHVAMEEGVVAAENALGMDRLMEEDLIPLCIFTHPEIASVGLTEREAKGKGEIKIGRFPLRSNPTALISGETDGLIKVIVGREGDKILGVHIIGHEASTLISIAASFMKQNVKAREFTRFIQAHPTPSEALKEAFLDVDGWAIHLPKPLRSKA
jgi:dihydrolipoamide dehydrogenase